MIHTIKNVEPVNLQMSLCIYTGKKYKQHGAVQYVQCVEAICIIDFVQ